MKTTLMFIAALLLTGCYTLPPEERARRDALYRDLAAQGFDVSGGGGGAWRSTTYRYRTPDGKTKSFGCVSSPTGSVVSCR